MEVALPGVSRRVQVRLIQGVNLLGVNDFPKGLSDPVCTIANRRTGEKLTSRQLDNTVNPRWHQSLFLEDVQLDDILEVCMWSTHVLSKRSTLIGQTEISVNVALRRSSDVLFHHVPGLTGHDENLLAVLNRLALGDTSSATAWTPDVSPHQALMAAPLAMPPLCGPPQTPTGVQLHAPSQVGRPHAALEQPTSQSFLEQDRKMPLRNQAHQEQVDSGHQFVQQQQNLQQEKQLQQQLQQIEQLQQFQNLERLHQQFEKQHRKDQHDLAQKQTSALQQQSDYYYQQPTSQVDSYVHDPTQYPSFPLNHYYPPYQNPLPAPSVHSYVQSAQPYQSLHVNDLNLTVAAHPVHTSYVDQQLYPFSSLPQSGHMQSNFPGELPIPYIAANLPSSSAYEPLPPSLPFYPGYPRQMSISGTPANAAMSSTSVTNGLKPPLCGVNLGRQPPSLEPLIPRYPEIPPQPACLVPGSLSTPSAPSYNGSLYPPSVPGTVPPPGYNLPDNCPQPPSYVSQYPLGKAQEDLPGQAHMRDERNGLHSNQCSGDGNFAFCSNGKESEGCLHTSGAHGPSLQASCVQEMENRFHDARPVAGHGALQSGNEDIRHSSSTALLCPEAVSSPYQSSPPRLVLRPNTSTEIAMPALEGGADGPMQAFSLPPSKRTAEDKGETPASSSDWSKAGSSCSLYASNVLSDDFETRSRLINVFTQMAYSYPLNLTEVLSSNATGNLPVNTKGYLVLAVIDSIAPSVDKLCPSNRYKKFNNLKNTFDATKLIGDTFGGKLGVLGKAVANNLAPIGNLLKDISALKVDVHVGESFPTFKIEMHHVKNIFGSVRQHWNEKYPAAQKIFQAPGARSIVKAQHAAL
jgi:C2 domain